MNYKFLILPLLCFFSFNVSAEFHSCERIKLDASGFKNVKSVDSWFNKRVIITSDFNQKTATYKNSTTDLWISEDNKRMKASFLRTMSNGKPGYYCPLHQIALTFVFLANGEVHADLSQEGGYKSSAKAIYKCSGWNGTL